MESTTERVEIRRELEIEASPETVWELLVDPRKATRWWGQEVSFDLRPGGKARIVLTAGSIVSGEVLEVDPPRRLVFTFGWERGGAGPEIVPAGSSTVEIELSPSPAGTTLRLKHGGLPSAEAAAGHGEGWNHYLARLGTCARGGDPGPDPWVERHG